MSARIGNLPYEHTPGGSAPDSVDDGAAVDISVIIPAFREELAIESVVRETCHELAKLQVSWEVIVVDDASGDRTGELARDAGATVITHPYNKGYGAALKTGIRSAAGLTVIFMDADGQHRPQDLSKLIESRGAFQAVVGARRRSEGSPAWRKPGKMLLGAVVDHLVGRSIPDFNSGFRAVDRRI